MAYTPLAHHLNGEVASGFVPRRVLCASTLTLDFLSYITYITS